MKQRNLLLILCLSLGSLSLTLGAQDLWDKAMVISENNQHWLAQTISVKSQQLDNQGRVSGQGDMVIHRTFSPGGEINMTVETSGDGSPDPVEFLKTGLGTPYSLRPYDAPGGIFSTEAQNQLQLQRIKEEILNGTATVVYCFLLKAPHKVEVSGRIWLDQRSGLPLKVTTRHDDDGEGLTNRISTIIYHQDPYAWYPSSIVTTATVRRMIFQRDIKITTSLKDYVVNIKPD